MFLLLSCFQAKIQKLKNSVPKGDKKKRKEVNAQVELMEAELAKKHAKDLEKLNDPIQVQTISEHIFSYHC